MQEKPEGTEDSGGRGHGRALVAGAVAALLGLSALGPLAGLAGRATGGTAGGCGAEPGPGSGPPRARPLQAGPELWVTNGPVSAVAAARDRLYLGGSFDHVGPHTGPVVALDRASGAVRRALRRLDAPVTALAADGQGGYYVATQPILRKPPAGAVYATPTAVDYPNMLAIMVGVAIAWQILQMQQGAPTGAAPSPTNPGLFGAPPAQDVLTVPGLHHVLPDGEIDPAWQAILPQERFGAMRVSSLLLHEDVLYVGGTFPSGGAETRACLLALSADRASPDRYGKPLPEQPRLRTQGAACAVNALALGTDEQGTTRLYVGGLFPDGAEASIYQANLAAWRPDTRSWDPDWNLRTDQAVHALAVAQGTLVVGGAFTRVNGYPRSHLARLRLSAPPRRAPDLATSSSSSSSSSSPSSPSFWGEPPPLPLPGATPRPPVPAVPPKLEVVPTLNDPYLLPWAPQFDGPVDALAVDERSQAVYVAGRFRHVDGVDREQLAALSLAAGADGWLLPWAPGGPTGRLWPEQPGHPVLGQGGVQALCVVGDRLYAAGSFTAIGGAPRRGLAAFDLSGAAPVLAPWEPVLGAMALGLAPAPEGVLVFGHFISVGGLARRNLAALDLETGAAVPGFPDASGYVTALALGPGAGELFVGGWFDAVGGYARAGLASVRTADGTVTGFAPGGGHVNHLRLDPQRGTLYYVRQAAGDPALHEVVSVPVGGLGLLRTLGEPLRRPPFLALSADGALLYTAERFTLEDSSSGDLSASVIVLDTATGARLFGHGPAEALRHSRFNGPVLALHVDGDDLYLGGEFDRVSTGLADAEGSAARVVRFRGGRLDPGFLPGGFHGPVLALHTRGGAVHAAGLFTDASAHRHELLLLLDAATGARLPGEPRLGLYPGWYPSWPRLRVGLVPAPDGSLYLHHIHNQVGDSAHPFLLVY